MLKHLSIENYALIRRLDIEFDSGLSIITGETGAGKSIMLGALGLVLGNRADTQVLFDETRKCIVEAEFKIDEYHIQHLFDDHGLDYEVISSFRREISSSGKSRAFINDTPVNLLVLKVIGEKLVNIHSQHEILTLNNRDFQLAVVDAVANNDKRFAEYRIIWRSYRHCLEELDKLKAKEAKSKAEHDYNKFLFDELDKANLSFDEIDDLLQEKNLLANADDLKIVLSDINQLLEEEPHELSAALKNCINQLAPFADSDKELNDIFQRFQSLWLELNELSRETIAKADRIVNDPEQLHYLTERIDMLHHLMHKHAVNSVAALIDIREELNNRLLLADTISDTINTKEKELASLNRQLIDQANLLSQKREEAIVSLSEEVLSIIASLGMPEASFSVKMEKLPMPASDGIDKVIFLFNANKGGKTDELAKTASGGERSRLMLAVKSILARKKLLPTIVFDEIDSGTSGEIATKTGKILKEMAGNMQVIVITHLPQIAALGKRHFKAIKESAENKTWSNVVEINNEERVLEIAGMLSDGNVSSAAIETAKQLMNN